MLGRCQTASAAYRRNTVGSAELLQRRSVVLSGRLSPERDSGDPRIAHTARRPAILAYVLYTSGSTGKAPKVSQISNRASLTSLALCGRAGLDGAGIRCCPSPHLSFDIAGLEIVPPAYQRVLKWSIASVETTAGWSETFITNASALERPLMQATPSTVAAIARGWVGQVVLRR